VTSSSTLQALLGAPVRTKDLRLGTVTGVYGDAEFDRVIGLEVTNVDGRQRFLPWVASRIEGGVVWVQSAFLLVETGELHGYERLGARLVRDPADLEGLAVGDEGRVERHAGGGGGVSLEVASGTPVS
jgi:hypothetical protein